MKKTAVIILNWNGEKLLREFLPSVVANTPEALADVIVADNGSSDGSLELLRAEFPMVKVLSFKENHGFAGGYNLAVEHCRDYPLCVLLNSDVETPPGWLEPLVETMESNSRLGACQPKIRSYERRDEFEYAGASGGFIDRYGYPYCRGRIFSTVEKDHGQYDAPINIFWATGAALMVRTELYLRLGGLDERFFAHMEEIDLCWRILLDGHTIQAIPASVVYHLGGGSLPVNNPRKTYLNFRNNLLLLHKNLPLKDARRTLNRRRLLDTLAFFRFLVAGQWANARAILKAHADFHRMRPLYTSHPATNLLSEAMESRFPTCGPRPNILTSYYLRGKRTFAEL